MSNTVEISRQLAERLALPMLRTPEYLFDHRDALDELRALLAAPAVERQEPVAWRTQCVHPRAGKQSGLFSKKDQAENWATHWRDACGLESTFEPLYTSPPAPVAVVLPEIHADHEWQGEYPSGDSFNDGYANGWNACLDNVKELNQI